MLEVDKKKVTDLLRDLEIARRLDPLLSVSTLCVFLYVARNPGACSADLRRDLGLQQPATIRHLQRLTTGSDQSASVGRGLELLEHWPDPVDHRRRLYKLSDRGAALLIQMFSHTGAPHVPR